MGNLRIFNEKPAPKRMKLRDGAKSHEVTSSAPKSATRLGSWKYGPVRSGDLSHPSAHHCHLVSIGSGAIGGRRRPSQRAGLRDRFSGRDQLRHKRGISPRTALMRQRRPPRGRHNRNQCASGAGGNAADFGNRHRKIQGLLLTSTDSIDAGGVTFLGSPRERD